MKNAIQVGCDEGNIPHSSASSHSIDAVIESGGRTIVTAFRSSAIPLVIGPTNHDNAQPTLSGKEVDAMTPKACSVLAEERPDLFSLARNNPDFFYHCCGIRTLFTIGSMGNIRLFTNAVRLKEHIYTTHIAPAFAYALVRYIASNQHLNSLDNDNILQREIRLLVQDILTFMSDNNINSTLLSQLTTSIAADVIPMVFVFREKHTIIETASIEDPPQSIDPPPAPTIIETSQRQGDDDLLILGEKIDTLLSNEEKKCLERSGIVIGRLCRIVSLYNNTLHHFMISTDLSSDSIEHIAHAIATLIIPSASSLVNKKDMRMTDVEQSTFINNLFNIFIRIFNDLDDKKFNSWNTHLCTQVMENARKKINDFLASSQERKWDPLKKIGDFFRNFWK